MSTSLAEQLQRLAVPQTAGLNRDKKRPSLLFDPKEAASLTRETVYQIAFEGYEELKNLNEAFAPFEINLFHVTSKDFERSIQDACANESLDRSIRRFLLLVSPYFLLSSTHKALEWLIHRFSIHEYNKDEFLLLILPYYETNIFVRALQLVNLKETSWFWLKSLQKPGIHLPKLALYNHAVSDPHFLKLISNHVVESVKLHENPNILTILFNFYCQTFTGSLEYAAQVNEVQVTQMLPALLTGIVSNIPNFYSGSHIVLAKLLLKTELSQKLLNKFVDKITHVQIPTFERQSTLLLVILYQTQKQFSEMSPQAIVNLSEKPWIQKSLRELKTAGYFVEPFLKVLFQETLTSSLLEVACQNSKVLLNELLREVKLDDAFISNLIHKIGNSYKPNKENYPDETKLWLRDFMCKIETQYPTAFDKEVNKIMKVIPGNCLTKKQQCFQDLLGNSHLGDKVSLFVKLHHPVPSIRQDTIRLVIRSYKDLKDRDRDFLSKTVLNKLQDENCEVVCETIHSKKMLTGLLGANELTKVLTALLIKAQQCKKQWWKVLRPALEILCDIVSSDVEIFLRLLPFLLPTDEGELQIALVIVSFSYLKKCDFLQALGNQLKRAKTPEKFSAIVFNNLSVNTNKLDTNELIVALKEVPESDRDVVHKYLASLLLCSSLQENCDPQLSSIVLDNLLAYLDGTQMYIIKSEPAVSSYIIAARKGKFPLQGFLHCLNTLILKTRSVASSLGSFDFSQKNEVSKFYCTLLHILLRGCYSKKDNSSMLYAETLKIYFDHFCSNFKSKMELFLNISNTECDFISPALQLRCLHSVTSLLSMKQEDILDFVNLDEVIVPYVLISSVSRHKEIRATAVNAVQVLLLTGRKNRDDNYMELLKHILKKREEVVLDREQACAMLCDVLDLSMKSKKDRFETILNYLLNLACQENRPFYLRSKLMEILSHVSNFEIFDRTCKVTLDMLKQIEASENNQKSLILSSCLKQLSNNIVSSLKPNTSVYQLLERALRSDSAFSIQAIKQMDDGVFDSLSFDVKVAVLDVIIEVATAAQNPDVLSTARQFFKHMMLDASLVLKQLTHMRDVQSPKSLITLKHKRRVSVIPSADIIDTLEWKKGVCVLEFVQNKKKIENSTLLFLLLFEILKKCLDFDEQAYVEYPKQLILSGILNLCDKIVEESIPENVFNIESIIQCIRASPNPQTHQHALLVLARASRFFPSQVLHHIMAIFTFMGSSVLRHDDAHSFQIINKTIDMLIPILIEEECNESILRILRVFVDAILDVPEHRRVPLFKNLLERLCVKENLHIFFLLVFEAHVVHANAEKQKDNKDPSSSTKRLVIAMNLTLEFPVDAVISSCIKLMQYLLALPEEKQEYMEMDSSLVFDIAHHTPKQFRHYKYILVTYIVNLLTLSDFVNKIAALSDSELLELESLYKSMIIYTLMYIQAVSKVSDKNSNTPQAQYWKVMLHHSYDILDSVNALLTPQMFLMVVRGLLMHKLSMIHRRSLELLNTKLQYNSTFFNDCEQSELFAMIPFLIHVIKQVESLEVDSEQELVIQTAILSLKLFIKRLGKEYPKKFIQILEFITNLVIAKRVQGNVLAFMILCLAELCSCLRAYAIPSLSKFMPVVIKLLKIYKQEDLPDLFLLSCVTAVQKIIDSLPLFLSPYLKNLLCELSSISAKWNAETENPKLATFTEKLTAIQQKIGSMIPPRVLIPIIDSSYRNLVGKNKFASIKPLMAVLAENLSHLNGTEIQSNIPDLMNFFLNALQFRADKLSTPEVTSEVEECIIKAVVTLILKLSEKTFRPLYYKIFDWAIRSDVKNERIITFYALSSEVARSLKGLFVLFAGHFLNNASTVLDACNPVKSKHLYFNDADKNIALTESVLKTLHGICLYDSQRFINKERFDVLMQPLVDQLENSLGGLESCTNRAESLVIPCIVQFCVAAGDDALWKQLNYQVLLKARHSQPEIRLIALKCLSEVIKRLGEDFMPLLPETIPFLSELLEDDEETVEKACQKAVQEMEKVLGESLQKYF